MAYVKSVNIRTTKDNQRAQSWSEGYPVERLFNATCPHVNMLVKAYSND